MSNSKEQGQFCWNELVTTDVKKAKQFYTQLFGWESHEMDMGNFVYTSFKKNGMDIGGMMPLPPDVSAGGVPPHWMAYIMVDNLEASVKQAKALGAKILRDKMVLPMGQFAIIQDPTGAAVSLWQSAPNHS